MKVVLANVWPLLLGMFMIMVGNGLQGTLLGLRADIEGFPVSVIGIVMSMYYVGYLAGWYIVPPMINTVGHIRVFAGFASLASSTVLLHGLFVEPYLWGIVRILSGISFVGLFIVAESWLNDTASNHLRGRLFSAYIFVIHSGLFMGQFLINLAPVANIGLFILISILVSLALIPVTLANKPSPGFEEPEHLPFLKLMRISPYAVACVLVAGFTGAAMLSMGPVYASKLGFEIPQIALMIAIFVLGCGAVPLFTGWLSDKFNRRLVLIAIAFVGLLVSAAAALSHYYLLLLVFIFGGCMTSVYSIATALMNDHLRPKQRTSATASLILLNGMSACIAPIMMGALMQFYGPNAFFAAFAVIFLCLFAFGIYRAYTGPEIRVENQGEFYAMPARPTPGIAPLGEGHVNPDMETRSRGENNPA